MSFATCSETATAFFAMPSVVVCPLVIASVLWLPGDFSAAIRAARITLAEAMRR